MYIIFQVNVNFINDLSQLFIKLQYTCKALLFRKEKPNPDELLFLVKILAKFFRKIFTFWAHIFIVCVFFQLDKNFIFANTKWATVISRLIFKTLKTSQARYLGPVDFSLIFLNKSSSFVEFIHEDFSRLREFFGTRCFKAHTKRLIWHFLPSSIL